MAQEKFISKTNAKDIVSRTKSLINNKQDKLIDNGDNQNIKTINGQSILGKGNISTIDAKTIFDINHSVGSIYEAYIETDMSTLSNGKWELAYHGKIGGTNAPIIGIAPVGLLDNSKFFEGSLQSNEGYLLEDYSWRDWEERKDIMHLYKNTEVAHSLFPLPSWPGGTNYKKVTNLTGSSSYADLSQAKDAVDIYIYKRLPD